MATEVLTLLKGNGAYNPLGFSCGDTTFWIISLANIPWSLLFMWYFRYQLLRETELKRAAAYRCRAARFGEN